MRSFFLSIILLLTSLSFAHAEPFRVQDVKRELEEAGVKDVSQAIIYGQPMLSGSINEFGFNAGLRNCSRLNGDEDLYCYEAAFKACVQVKPVYERIEVLEYANAYNQSRRLGYLVIEQNSNLGQLFCVQTLDDFQDENLFSYDEVIFWEQVVDDFRAFLADEDIQLVDDSIL